MKIGDTVYVPCKIMGICQMAYSEEVVLDLRVIEGTSGDLYSLDVSPLLSVFSNDIVTEK